MRRGIAICGLIAVGILAGPAAAEADYQLDVTPDGTMTLTGGIGIVISFDGSSSRYEVLDASGSASTDGTCQTDPVFHDFSSCPAGLVARIDATATLGIELDDAGADAVQVPSHLTLTGLQTTGYGGTGDDLIVSTHPSSPDDFQGGPGNDTIRAGPSSGNIEVDRLDGGEGNDTLDGGIGPDTIVGGPGTDTLSYSGRTDALGVELPEGAASEVGNGGAGDGPGSRDQISEMENVTGGSGADTLTGNSLANVLIGGGGADRLGSGGGDDSALGGGGADRLDGGRGVDELLGQKGIDRLFARDGRRDKSLSCGPGKNRRERARRDRMDPRAKSC